MGNCKCMDESSKLQLPLEQQNKTYVPSKMPTQTTQNQTEKNSTLTIPPSINKISHEPNPNFARPIESFPPLSQKIVDIDNKLGLFVPEVPAVQGAPSENKAINRPFKLHNGIIYQGQWYMGQLNGEGIFYLPGGSFLRGYSVNNQVIGKARFIRQNGNYYEGYVKDNKANGPGILYENGVLYKGVFQNNYINGKGSQESATYKFQGDYHNGSKNQGKLTWDLHRAQPTVYQGLFFDDQFNGQGRLYNQIGQYEGRFENGKKKGKGIFRWKNGERFEGIYDNDMKNGQGRMYNTKDIIVLQGVWQNDKYKG